MIFLLVWVSAIQNNIKVLINSVVDSQDPYTRLKQFIKGIKLGDLNQTTLCGEPKPKLTYRIKRKREGSATGISLPKSRLKLSEIQAKLCFPAPTPVTVTAIYALVYIYLHV